MSVSLNAKLTFQNRVLSGRLSQREPVRNGNKMALLQIRVLGSEVGDAVFDERTVRGRAARLRAPLSSYSCHSR